MGSQTNSESVTNSSIDKVAYGGNGCYANTKMVCGPALFLDKTGDKTTGDTHTNQGVSNPSRKAIQYGEN